MYRMDGFCLYHTKEYVKQEGSNNSQLGRVWGRAAPRRTVSRTLSRTFGNNGVFDRLRKAERIFWIYLRLDILQSRRRGISIINLLRFRCTQLRATYHMSN